MKFQFADVAKDGLSLLLIGLGLSMSPHEFFGGLFLALAAGSAIATHRGRNEKIVVIMSWSGIVAIIVLLITQVWGHFGLPPQLIMALAGAGSGTIVTIWINLMEEAEERSSSILVKILNKLIPKIKEEKDQ